MSAAHGPDVPSWIGSLRDGWTLLRVKDVAHVPRVALSGEPQLYVAMEHVQAHRGEAEPVEIDPDVTTGNTVRAGTVCFGKLRPYLAKAFVARQSLAVSTEFLPLVPNAGMAPDYLCFALISKGFIDNISDEVAGAKMPRVDWDVLGTRRIPVPPLPVQLAIASHLKKRLELLDKQVDLLTRRRRALGDLKKAVREELVFGRGLKAPPADPARDSWHGPIPHGWQSDRLANLFRAGWWTGGEGLPILSVSIHRGISDRELGDDETERKVSRSEDRGLYKRVWPNDIVYNQMRAWQGGFGVAKVHGLVSPAYVVARPRRPVVSAYIEHMLRTPSAIEEMRRRSRGIIDFRLRLYWDKFKDIHVPLPPLEEQMRIAAELDERVRLIEAQIAAIDAMSEKMALLRKSLIHEAVSGAVEIGVASDRGVKPSKLRAVA